VKYKKCCGKPGSSSNEPVGREQPASDLFKGGNVWDTELRPKTDFITPSEDWDDFDAEEDSREELELFGDLIREKMTPAMLSSLFGRFGTMLFLDPFYNCFRLDEADTHKIVQLLMENPKPDEPLDFETPKAKKVLTSIVKKKQYLALQENAYAQLMDDFEFADEMDCKTLCYLLMMDIDRNGPKSTIPSIFWIQVAQVSAYESAKITADEMEQLRSGVNFLIQHPEQIRECGLEEGLAEEEAFQRVLQDQKLFSAMYLKIYKAYEQMAEAIETGAVQVNLSADWALPGLVFKRVMESELEGEFDPEDDENLLAPEDFYPYFFNPQFIRDCQTALSAANLPQQPAFSLELARHVFCDGTSPHFRSERRLILEAICKQFYWPLETLAQRYPQQDALLGQYELDPRGQEELVEQVVGDAAINAALEADNPTRAEALALSALLCSFDVPERRFHFAERMAEMAVPEPGLED
jgi:hypothetical protein